jgi:hypothetical protein
MECEQLFSLPWITRMKTSFLLTAVVVAMTWAALVSTANAQYKGKARPFDTTARRPSVSPYMNLINNNTGAATNYQSLVRPQIDQQNLNTRSASAIRSLQRNQGASSSSSGSKGNKSTAEGGNVKLRPTGHTSSRENYAHYFPGLK